MNREKEIQKIIAEWLVEGNEAKGRMPKHPEFVYRETNEWKGWHDFLGDESKDSIEQDDLENEAWERFQKKSDN